MWDEGLALQFKVVWGWKVKIKLTNYSMSIIFLEYNSNEKYFLNVE